MNNQHLSTRLFWIVGSFAILPLLIFGGIVLYRSITTLNSTARESLLEISEQAANRVEELISTPSQLMNGITEILRRPYVDRATRLKLLEAYLLRFPELKRAALFSSEGKMLYSSDVQWRTIGPGTAEAIKAAEMDHIAVSNLSWQSDLLPTVAFIKRVSQDEILLIEVNIVRIWQTIDSITVGKTGKFMMIDKVGHVIAHGSAEGKKFILDQASDPNQSQPSWPKADNVEEYTSISGKKVIGAATRIKSLGWLIVAEQDVREAYGPARNLLILILALSSLLILIVIYFGRSETRRVTQPIEELVEATRLVSKGDYSANVNIYGNDERAQLGHAFNEMIGQLKKLHEEIALRERMSIIGRIASELIHDLRHPVRNIENAAKILRMRSQEPGVIDMFERVTQREFEGLSRFIGNLEQLTSDPPVQLGVVNWNDEIKELIHIFEQHPENKNITWRFETSGENAVAEIDRFMLRRILQNLMQNAFESQPAGGKIEVILATTPHFIVTVRDTGAGIPSQVLPTLFEEFKTTKRRGLGLGLAICKKLTHKLGGTLEASNHSDGGAQFILSFPNLVQKNTLGIHNFLG